MEKGINRVQHGTLEWKCFSLHLYSNSYFNFVSSGQTQLSKCYMIPAYVIEVNIQEGQILR